MEFIRLKSGQSVKVAFLHDPENPNIIASAEYNAHGDFQAKIFSHPCIATNGYCPSCEAGVKRTTRKLIAFLDLADGQRKVFECSKKQYEGIKNAIADYVEDGSVFELAFKLSKTGEGTATTVTATPILKMSADDKKAMENAVEPVDVEFFDAAVGEPTVDWIKQKIAGYKPAEKTDEPSDPTSQF